MKTGSQQSAGSTPDGRVRRGERNRDAIVAALFDLIGRGILQPTAQQVADQGGVGIRSVFRHFTEMESLFAAIDARLELEATRMLAAEREEGDLDGRARAVVRVRAALFERIAPFKRSANVQRWRSPFLEDRHKRMQDGLRADLLDRLPELRVAPVDLLEAADLVTSFEAWDRLRGDRQIGRKTTVAVLERLLLCVLGELGSDRSARRTPGAIRKRKARSSSSGSSR